MDANKAEIKNIGNKLTDEEGTGNKDMSKELENLNIIVDEKKYYYRNGKFCDENKNEIGNTIKNAVQYITSQKVSD